MNRREAISAVGWMLGGTVVGANMLISCSSNAAKVNDLFDEDQVAMLDEVGETILPATDTPGAKAANIGAFMAIMVQDCYKPEDQKVFMNGLKQLDEASDEKFGKKFMKLDAKQRTAFLTAMDGEQKQYMINKEPEQPSHYFRMMKELTMLGYFTSEVGATQALRYVAIPGRYEGCIDYKKGDKAWAI